MESLSGALEWSFCSEFREVFLSGVFECSIEWSF